MIFKIDKHLTIVCESGSRRGGFYHKATLYNDNRDIATAKSLYVNRTWESYPFNSVLCKLWESSNLTITETQKLKKYIDNYQLTGVH